MTRKVVLVTDPGIDGAFAVALALLDPDLEVLGLAATAGNVPWEQATRNVQILVEQIDPPRLPRLGTAPAIEYDVAGRLGAPEPQGSFRGGHGPAHGGGSGHRSGSRVPVAGAAHCLFGRSLARA